MAVVPALPTVTGGVYTSSQVSQIVQAVSFAMNPPIAELTQAVSQSITSATWTALTFDTTVVDANPTSPFVAGHSNSVNNTRYTAVYAGWYLLGGGYNSGIGAGTVRGTRWAVNGTAVNGSSLVVPPTTAVGDGYAARAILAFLNVGDYVELQVYQNTGSPLSTDVTGENMSSMTVVWKHT